MRGVASGGVGIPGAEGVPIEGSPGRGCFSRFDVPSSTSEGVCFVRYLWPRIGGACLCLPVYPHPAEARTTSRETGIRLRVRL